MGWCYGFVGYGKDRKELIIDEVYRGNENLIEYIEVKSSNVWVIENDHKGNRCGVLFLTSYKDGEFGYKDIGISCCPLHFNCSKKYYKICKEIYENSEFQWAKDWLKKWENENEKDKITKDKIKSLKVGDIIEFENANYNGKKQWRISEIIGSKIYFEGYNLIGWKKKEFKILTAK